MHCTLLSVLASIPAGTFDNDITKIRKHAIRIVAPPHLVEAAAQPLPVDAPAPPAVPQRDSPHAPALPSSNDGGSFSIPFGTCLSSGIQPTDAAWLARYADEDE